MSFNGHDQSAGSHSTRYSRESNPANKGLDASHRSTNFARGDESQHFPYKDHDGQWPHQVAPPYTHAHPDGSVSAPGNPVGTLSFAGMVLSIVAVFYIPFGYGVIAIALTIIGIIFAGIGLKKDPHARVFALIGIIMGPIIGIFAILTTLVQLLKVLVLGEL